MLQYTPLPYQAYATDCIYENSHYGMLLQMGLGKTVSTLTAIVKLFKAREIRRVLVIAPATVAANTWPDELRKWYHLRTLSFVALTGSEKQRIAGLRENKHVYIISCDNVAWLVSYLAGSWPFDMVIADESSKFKTHNSKRTEALKIVTPFIDRFVILTGTPMSKGYIDLWSQFYFLDKGARLGKNISSFRNKWFTKDYHGWGYELRDAQAGKEITDAISDICVSMKQKDYLSLPDRITRDITLNMPDKLKQQYKEFEREKVMEIIERDKKITALNAAALSSKLLQFANGAVYDADRDWHEVHTLKLDALEDIVDTAAGHPVLVFYEFQHDVPRIMERLKKYKPQAGVKKGDVDKWNAGNIPVWLLHPASAGHGLNLQAGGHIIVFFGHNWSGELRQQAIARLERMGQQFAVVVHNLIVRGTMDERVIARLAGKLTTEADMMDAVKVIVGEYVSI